jgi:hypothetical protein
MNSNSETNSSIRLSQLNPELKDRLTKFDTGNDGALSIEEALQGLVALQKQSNNYKKMVYLLIPILILLLVSMLGINILANNLTKDIQSSNNSNNFVPILSNKNGDIVNVNTYSENIDFLYFLSNFDAESLSSISSLSFDRLILPINGIIIDGIKNATTKISISTAHIWFSLDSDGNTSIDYVSTVNGFNQQVYHIVSENLNRISNDILLQKTSNLQTVIKSRDNRDTTIKIVRAEVKPQTRGIGGFKCGRVSNCYG